MDSRERKKELSTEKNSIRTALQSAGAVVRFLIFSAFLFATAFFLTPDEYHAMVSPLWLGGGILLIAILFGAVWYVMRPRYTVGGIKTAINIEATAAVVLGMIILILASVILLFTAETPRTAILGFIPVAIYTYYIYRIIKEALRITNENERIRKQYGELLEIDQEKSAFINVTSHQLRTPLSEIRWSVELAMREKDLSANVRGLLQKSMESIERLVAIVDALYKARTVEELNQQIRKDAVDPVMLIQEVIGELSGLTRQKEVAISFQPLEKTLTIPADREELKSALKQILDNAVRYSPKGRVQVSLSTEPGILKIRVEDTGIGIALEEYNRVFKKFFRGKNALLVEPNGSGVGLHTAKQIINQHGGTIEFFSQLNKGTVFIIVLPQTS